MSPLEVRCLHTRASATIGTGLSAVTRGKSFDLLLSFAVVIVAPSLLCSISFHTCPPEQTGKPSFTVIAASRPVLRALPNLVQNGTGVLGPSTVIEDNDGRVGGGEGGRLVPQEICKRTYHIYQHTLLEHSKE